MAKSVIRARVVANFLALGAVCSAASTPAFAQSVPTTPTEAPPPVTGTLTIASDGTGTGAPDAGALTGRPNVAIRLTTQRPRIDGNLDDVVWKDAAHLDTFVQQRPKENTPATEDTDVYIAYDEQNLYVGIHAHYSNPASMRVNMSERDRVFRDDLVHIIFDTFLDQQRAFVFSVNGYGVQADSLMSGGGGGGGRGGGGGGGLGDRSWDALFSSAGHPVEDGWTAELAIPFKSLRYPVRERDQPHRWGFQIQRDIQGKNESDVWSPVLRSVASFLGQMGTLDGMTNLSTSRNLEILPTFTAVRQFTLDDETGVASNSNSPEAGVNLKYGLTSDLTVDFTANPDFSQIESDQPQITTNQRFPVFYPELRPFFLEGQEIFEIPGPVTFVHTRTIIDPQYGAKMTGKIGDTAVGVLVANDVAPGRTDDASDPVFNKKANFFFGRARYDLYSESSIGVIATDRELGDFFSRAGGFDLKLKLGETHRFEAVGLFSDQMSNDEDDFGAHSGNMYNVTFRRDGRGLSYFMGTSGISPGFRNDSGFVRRTDFKDNFANVSYRWYPESWIVNWGPRANYSRAFDYNGVQQEENRGINIGFQFARNINAGAGISRDMEHYVGIDYWKNTYSFNANINASRFASVNFFFNGGDEVRHDEDDPALGTIKELNINFNLRPISQLSSTVMVNTSRLMNPATGGEFFNVTVMRWVTSYQFTTRLTLRSIVQRDTSDHTLQANLLGAYRVNSGTAFFIGYDDHYQAANSFNDVLYPTSQRMRTNRAIFTKLQYLFRM